MAAHILESFLFLLNFFIFVPILLSPSGMETNGNIFVRAGATR